MHLLSMTKMAKVFDDYFCNPIETFHFDVSDDLPIVLVIFQDGQ